MNYKVKKIAKSIIVLIIFLLLSYLTKNILSGIACLMIKGLLDYFFPNIINSVYDSLFKLFNCATWKKSQKNLEKNGELQEDTIIRISFAYLFRIKIDGKYFLVQNTRTSKYQPVGGAYKFNKEEAVYLSKYFNVENDDCIPVDKVTKRDYRLLVKNKYLRDFIERFDKTKNREDIYDLSREFEEEIFNTNILKKEDFGELSYKYLGRHFTEITETSFKPFELLLADIVEVILTDEQEGKFRDIMSKKSNLYTFATAEEIKRCGINVGTNNLNDIIANHTFKIISENSDLLTMKNKFKETFTIKM